MTKLPKPSSWSAHYDLTYDAWNRLVKVAEGGATVAEYEYDGRNFRTVKKSYSGGQLAETRHFYYNAGWQVLEERVGASTAADRQYVWGVRYMDDLVLRDRDVAAGGDLGVTGSGLDERFYAMQDPNWNVLAIANVSGTVQERYRYTAYGTPTFLTSTFTPRNPNASAYAWDALYTGRQLDAETGLYQYRNRYYHAELGRFVNRDPVGYRGGSNLYVYVGNRVLIASDPLGLRDQTLLEYLKSPTYKTPTWWQIAGSIGLLNSGAAFGDQNWPIAASFLSHALLPTTIADPQHSGVNHTNDAAVGADLRRRDVHEWHREQPKEWISQFRCGTLRL